MQKAGLWLPSSGVTSPAVDVGVRTTRYNSAVLSVSAYSRLALTGLPKSSLASLSSPAISSLSCSQSTQAIKSQFRAKRLRKRQGRHLVGVWCANNAHLGMVTLELRVWTWGAHQGTRRQAQDRPTSLTSLRNQALLSVAGCSSAWSGSRTLSQETRKAGIRSERVWAGLWDFDMGEKTG